MDDTICAISSALGVGAISIIRVSGCDAINIVNNIFKEKDLNKEESHSISYGHIYDDSEVIDEVLLMLMRSPRTYTTEDTIEINCHGGINTTNKILEVLIKNGCRLAEHGEFTKRAFLNGRINLMQAESVQDLITSKTDASRNMALNNVRGILSKKISNIREDIVKLLANIEVNIDYPEYEDEVEVTHELLKNILAKITTDVNNIVEDSKNSKIIKEGINVAIIGSPNVGKSSILNFLLDEEKAIVTDIPGTTRDIVEGSISLNGIQINFIDTAGIRDTSDVVEKIGVNKSKDIATKSDLILIVLNNNNQLSEEEKIIIEEYKKYNHIIFVNKNDLEKKLDDKNLSNIIYGNTIDLNGLDELKQELINRFSLDKINTSNNCYLANLRQIELITKASESLKKANESLNNDMPIDLIEIDVKEAWEYLGQLIGESYKEELVDNIFANFCLGK